MQHKKRIFLVIVNSDKGKWSYDSDPSDPVQFVRKKLPKTRGRWSVGSCRTTIREGDLLLFRFSNKKLKARRGVYAVGIVDKAPSPDADQIWWLKYHYLAVPTQHLLHNPILDCDCARLFPRSFGSPIQQLAPNKHNLAEQLLATLGKRQEPDREALADAVVIEAESNALAISPLDDAGSFPAHVTVTTSRVIRNTARGERLKQLYDGKCQLCCLRIEARQQPYGFYAEVHHLRPLGGGHAGKDNIDNMLVLCPTCHAEFDLLIVGLNPHTGLVTRFDGKSRGRLTFRPGHQLDKANVGYTWRCFTQQ
jgi:hypothetical protein